MNAVDARSFIDQHDLDAYVDAVVSDAPPLPASAVDLWRRAVVVTLADAAARLIPATN